ncbi:hypothetical protein HDA32_004298 [Spinactinospora alkalitolerans]|uniref:Uncharacterized protein n=1 Tax=Spinactinospora alkalitolerans TaxID=687207 RepID=A0A852TZ23_9ACTN|nr:hypothetical protein [Spinactinospora alkalitolerans]
MSPRQGKRTVEYEEIAGNFSGIQSIPLDD